MNGIAITGFNESWWLGLSALHTAVRPRAQRGVRRAQPTTRWSDDQVYNTARLIVSALIAKIHTVEWTPAILATKAIDIGLNGNWSGPKDWMTKLTRCAGFGGGRWSRARP